MYMRCIIHRKYEALNAEGLVVGEFLLLFLFCFLNALSMNHGIQINKVHPTHKSVPGTGPGIDSESQRDANNIQAAITYPGCVFHSLVLGDKLTAVVVESSV